MAILPIYNLGVSKRGNVSVFLEVMEKVLNSIDVLSKVIILAGDFNINFSKTNKNKTLFCNQLYEYVLVPLVDFLTRGKHCIDNVFINLKVSSTNVTAINTRLSDYYGINFDTNLIDKCSV